MQMLIRLLLIVAAAAALAYPAGMLADSVWGQDVILLATVNDEATVEFEREISDLEVPEPQRAAAIVAIYGSNPKPELETDRILLFDDSGVIRPVEDESLALLAAGSAAGEGEYPYQSASLLYLTSWVSGGGCIAIVVLMGLLLLLRRRNASA